MSQVKLSEKSVKWRRCRCFQ